MQVFRPEDVDLSTVPPNPGFGAPTGENLPVMRSAVRQESRDGGLRSGMWDCAAGTATFRHTADEWAYILEGEVQVTAAGEVHHLKAGDVFYTPAGESMVWVVPVYVRKVWVHRRPPIVGRIRRKLAGCSRTRGASRPSPGTGSCGRAPGTASRRRASR